MQWAIHLVLEDMLQAPFLRSSPMINNNRCTTSIVFPIITAPTGKPFHPPIFLGRQSSIPQASASTFFLWLLLEIERAGAMRPRLCAMLLWNEILAFSICVFIFLMNHAGKAKIVLLLVVYFTWHVCAQARTHCGGATTTKNCAKWAGGSMVMYINN